jgi:hypothetical protein
MLERDFDAIARDLDGDVRTWEIWHNNADTFEQRAYKGTPIIRVDYEQRPVDLGWFEDIVHPDRIRYRSMQDGSTKTCHFSYCYQKLGLLFDQLSNYNELCPAPG